MRPFISLSLCYYIFSMYLNFEFFDSHPWPPVKKRIVKQKCEYPQPDREVNFNRRTTKSLIQPDRFKGWKGKR